MGGGGGGGGGYNPNRTYDSSGPDIKIRGTASHVYEKYLQLARDANASGDRVMAENYLQHAEHYFRIMAVAQAQAPAFQPTPQASAAAVAVATTPPGTGVQPRLPVGMDEQPYVEVVQTSAPSFSLNEPAGVEDDDDDDDDEDTEGEDVEATAE
jgi:hypothetical protein